MDWEWEKVWLVMSYCRARRVSALRLGWVWKDPWAPGTDLHRCRIRRVEFVVDYRKDVTSGRDEKDVDVRSCSCGVAEKKSATRWLSCIAVLNSRENRNPILYGIARY
jgi:hypothetical protein